MTAEELDLQRPGTVSNELVAGSAEPASDSAWAWQHGVRQVLSALARRRCR
jgi:hypothetical protein